MISENTLCTSWSQKKLSEVVDFLDHLRRPVTAANRKAGPYPYYGANGQQDSVADYLFDEPLILLAEDGGYFGDPHRSIAYQINGKSWVNNHAHVLRPKAGFDIRFLCRQLEHYDVTPFINGATRQKLNKSSASEIPVVVPPLEEQKRIAAILDQADAIRRKREESLQLADAFLRSVFLDMFGDPVTNPKGWKKGILGGWLENIDSGWSPKCLDRNAESNEWGVLKLGSVTRCEFNETEQKALPSDLLPRPNIEVQQGDLLFTRKNTYDLVAAAAYVHKVRPKLMLPDLIFRLRLKPDSKVEPRFLWKLLTESHQRQIIQGCAGGAAGSMPNISKAKLKVVSLIKPPIGLQHRFAAIVESVEQQKARIREQLAEAEGLFASLQQRAFKGEL